MRLRNQVVNEAENFAQEETLSPVLIKRLSKDMDEQLKLADNLVDVVDRADRNIFVTLLRYSVDRPESSFTQVRLFARKKEHEKCQQIVYVKNILEDVIYLPDVMNSVYHNFIAQKPFLMSYKK